jgi:hypothetical protein
MGFIFFKTVYIRFHLDETLDFLMTWQRIYEKRGRRVPYHKKCYVSAHLLKMKLSLAVALGSILFHCFQECHVLKNILKL